MAANVFFVIIPAHRKLVAAMEEGREPDAAPLLEAKNRSVHNNYLTLPVVFTMLAGHFAFVFGADEAWLVFVAIAVLTALIRVFFNRWHMGRRDWWIPAVAAVGVIALAFWLQPEEAGSDVTVPVAFEQIQPVIAERCTSCHSGVSAPLGVRLETREEIEARIDDIERQAVLTQRDAARKHNRHDRRRARAPRRLDRAVALGNVTGIAWTLRPATADDRDFIVELTRAAMGPYLEATFGWDEAAQAVYFDEGFDPSGGQIIEVEGVDVGEILIEERRDELVLTRLALLPDWHGRGIGSAIVRMLIDRARELESALVLQVFKANPRATRLYESLGFLRTGESDTDVYMRLEPKL